MVVEDHDDVDLRTTRPNWTEKYLGSDHHTDRLMRTVVGLEDESCVRHHWYQDNKWPVYNKAQVESARRAATETRHIHDDEDDVKESQDADDDKKRKI